MTSRESAGSYVQLQPPERFNFKHPDEWPRWKRRFMQFLTASALIKEDEERQVSTLMYCLGDEGDDVLTSTGISDADRKKFDTVVQKFDSYFEERRNVIYERARFNRRDQKRGETAEEYITALYSLIETCAYGNMRDELLRDRLVVGIRDTALSDKLQLDPTLTLEKAKKAIRQNEAVREHRVKLNGGDSKELAEVEEVRHGGKHTRGAYHKPQRWKPGGARLSNAVRGTQLCKRCGKQRHLVSE